jgi:hypothetical protein
MNILLDYFFPVTSIEPTPAASTAFLKQVCVIGSPADGGVVKNVPHLITSAASASTYFGANASAEVAQLFAGGLSRCYVMAVDDLDLADALEGHESDFFTVLISSDFDKDDVNASQATLTVNGDLTFTSVGTGSSQNAITVAIVNSDSVTAGDETVVVTGNDIVITIDAGVSTATQIKAAFDAEDDATDLVTCTIVSGQGGEAQAAAAEANLAGGDGLFLGAFTGVVGVSEVDDSFLATQAAISNRSAWHTTSGNKAKNMCYAFGKLLSNALNWRNQQYIAMPFADDVDTLGEAEALFDDKVNFVISDDEFGERLALFSAGGKAITAPYIKRNLEIDLQSAALSYVSGNQPAYTKVQAALLQDELEKVIADYVDDELIEEGTISIELEEDNFVASGDINISEPKALWRIFAEMRQTL